MRARIQGFSFLRRILGNSWDPLRLRRLPRRLQHPNPEAEAEAGDSRAADSAEAGEGAGEVVRQQTQIFRRQSPAFLRCRLFMSRPVVVFPLLPRRGEGRLGTRWDLIY